MKNEKSELLKLSKMLAEAQTIISLLLDEDGPRMRKLARGLPDASKEIAQLKALGRTAAEHKLEDYNQKMLGDILVGLGGGSSDKRKPKVWLMEQILWRLFDFERGHERIRNQGKPLG